MDVSPYWKRIQHYRDTGRQVPDGRCIDYTQLAERAASEVTAGTYEKVHGCNHSRAIATLNVQCGAQRKED